MSPEEPWTMLGYTADALIGRGATADVWRGRDLASGELVALKRLAAGAGLLSVRAEIAAATSQPTGVVRVRDVGVVDERVVIVMDLAAGGSLADLLAVRGKLPAPEVVATIGPLAAALAELHGRLLVHGDISPGNVLYAADGSPLLADFGMSRVGVEPAEVVAATFGFVDPAVAAGGDPDAASDVFGLAAVAYAALTGRAPWLGSDAEGVLANAVAGRRPALRRLAPTVPAALDAVIEASLSLDPSARPRAAEMAVEVMRACDPAPVQIQRSLTIPSDAQVTQRRRPPPADDAPHEFAAGRHRRGVVVAAIVAAIVLLVIAIGAGIAWGRAGQTVAQVPPVLAPAAPSTVPSSSPAPSVAAQPTVASPPASSRQSEKTVWLQRIRRLASERTKAIDHRSIRALDRVYVSGCAAMRADARTVARLVDSRMKPEGLRSTIGDAQVHRVSADRATATVTISTATWRLVDQRTGRVAEVSAPTPNESMHVRLTRTADGWRIASLSAA